jgi:hypothetical protein
MGAVGTAATQPLVAEVTTGGPLPPTGQPGGGTPVSGATVTFTVLSGSATVSPATVATDASGLAKTTVTFGATPGPVQVSATLSGSSSPSMTFLLRSTATTNTACSSQTAQSPAVGAVLTDLSGTGICLTGATGGSDYALVAFNANPDSTLTSAPLTVTSTNAQALASASVIPAAGSTMSAAMLARRAQQNFDLHLRTIANRQLASRIPDARAWQRALAQRSGANFSKLPTTPTIGQVVPMNANGLDACTNQIPIGARVAAVTSGTIVVADTANPTGGFTDAEYASFATTFDTLINPLDVNAFGNPTDIDGNGKIIILFTKEVNKLTPRGSQGVVGGFFFERDLFPHTGTSDFQGCAGSNQAEMFYVMVPDPNAVFSDARSKSGVLNLTVSTLAHEYQHLINASRRMYVNDADDFEQVWLNEGLSHIAEELLYYRLSGKAPRQNIGVNDIAVNSATQAVYFNNQGDNLSRFEIFLEQPNTTGVYSNNDSLQTRGATWNLLRYLADHRSGTSSDADTWKLLDNSRTTGLTNLASVFGSNIMTQIRDWGTSVFSDDVPGVTDPRFLEPSWNHRSIFPRLCNDSSCSSTLGRYPLTVIPLSDNSPANTSIVAGGAAYIRFTVPQGANASIDWKSTGLATASPFLQFTVVRSR